MFGKFFRVKLGVCLSAGGLHRGAHPNALLRSDLGGAVLRTASLDVKCFMWGPGCTLKALRCL